MDNQGQLFSTFNYLVPAAGSTNAYVVKLVAAVDVSINFSDISSQTGIPFNPSGIQVDNLAGTEAVTIKIPETGFTMQVIQGNQQGMMFPAPAGCTVLVSGDGATIAFVDYPVIPYNFYPN